MEDIIRFYFIYVYAYIKTDYCYLFESTSIYFHIILVRIVNIFNSEINFFIATSRVSQMYLFIDIYIGGTYLFCTCHIVLVEISVLILEQQTFWERNSSLTE